VWLLACTLATSGPCPGGRTCLRPRGLHPSFAPTSTASPAGAALPYGGRRCPDGVLSPKRFLPSYAAVGEASFWDATLSLRMIQMIE